MRYTELTYDNLTECINSLDKETNHIVNKIVEYEKAVLKNPKSDIIESLIEYKEIYKEMEENNHNLAFIRYKATMILLDDIQILVRYYVI